MCQDSPSRPVECRCELLSGEIAGAWDRGRKLDEVQLGRGECWSFKADVVDEHVSVTRSVNNHPQADIIGSGSGILS